MISLLMLLKELEVGKLRGDPHSIYKTPHIRPQVRRHLSRCMLLAISVVSLRLLDFLAPNGALTYYTRLLLLFTGQLVSVHTACLLITTLVITKSS